jgi:tRNA threonylcarbamoyl adenosine modification protein YeaZ
MPSNRPTLVLNGAETRFQVVLGTKDDLLFAEEMRAPNRGMTYLPLALQRCFEASGYAPRDLSGIACVRGPGAFTGLRIVLSMAIGLARGSRLPMAGLDYLPLLAALPSSFLTGELWVATYARMSMVYLQGFSCPDGSPLTDPQPLFEEQVVEQLVQRASPVTLLGSGLNRNPDLWRERLPEATVLGRIWQNPSSHALLDQAFKTELSQEPIEPLYLRPSDAEANLGQIAAKRGFDLGRAKG